MKRSIGLAFIAIAATLIARPSTGQEAEGLQAITAEGIRAHVEFLADDLLEGRGTGTRGYELAANYVASQFRALGLEPAGDDASYFQQVTFRRSHVVPEGTSLVLIQGSRE